MLTSTTNPSSPSPANPGPFQSTPQTAQLPPIKPLDQVPSLASYHDVSPSWLWPDHIPCGSITLLDGPSGSGKTQFLADLAARVSSAQTMPDGSHGVHGSVIFISPFDPTLHHLGPTLSLAHADPSRVFPFSLVPNGNPLLWTSSSPSLPPSPLSPASPTSFSPFCFDDDTLIRLDLLIRHTHCRLLIIDAWSATLDDTDSFSQRTIARLLHDLRDIVSEHTLACILVRSFDPRARTNHLTPADKSPYLPLNAPTHLAILPDPLAPDHSLLVSTRHPFSAATPILQFHLTPHPTHRQFPQFHWDGPSDLSLDDLSLHLTTPTLVPTREHILRILQQQSTTDPMTIPALLELLPTLSYELLRKTLQRMVHDHQLSSPKRGLYALPSPSASPDPLSPSPVPDTVPTAVPNPVSLSPVSNAVPNNVPPSPIPDAVPNNVSPSPVPTAVPNPVSPPSTPPTLFQQHIPQAVSIADIQRALYPSPIPTLPSKSITRKNIL